MSLPAPGAARRKLPIGIQTFRLIREEGRYYVDKTPWVRRLVDEYDKPILDALEKPEVAKANRDRLRGLYSVIKDCEAHIRFTLLTGVSKFSKVSLFSGLNNLIDITLDPDYSAVCGYTDRDLDAVFAPELPGLDRDKPRARIAPAGGNGSRVRCRRLVVRNQGGHRRTPPFAGPSRPAAILCRRAVAGARRAVKKRLAFRRLLRGEIGVTRWS